MAWLLAFIVVSLVPPELEQWYSLCAAGDWSGAVEAADSLALADPSLEDALAAEVIAASLDHGTGGSVREEPLPADTAGSLYSTAMGALLMSCSDGFIDDAELRLQEAIALDSSNTLAWYLKGMLHLRLGNADGSRASLFDLERALEIDPGFLPAGLEEARVLRDMGDMDAALGKFLEIAGTGTPCGRMAVCEYLLLADSLGLDIVEGPIDAASCDWEELAREQSRHRRGIAVRAVRRSDDGASYDRAVLYFELEDFRTAAGMSRRLLAEGIEDSASVMTVLGLSLFEMGSYGEAGEVFRSVLERDRSSVDAHVHLGLLAELSGNTGTAVDHFLSALELDIYNQVARSRLRDMADDSYDPEEVAGSSTGLGVGAGADLSIERGSRSLFEWGGSASVSYRFDERGSSVDGSFGGRSVTWEESNGIRTDTLNTNRGWASLGFDYWFSEDYYVQAASSWDRQMYTERPWQVSSYAALGWQKWILSWFWFSPRLGLGSVNARWTTGREDLYTDDFSIFAAAGLMYRKPYTFVRSAEISGNIYFPPDDPENFISRGSVSLAFRTWNPLYVTIGYSIDYTRSPAVPTWKKFNTSFTTSLNLDLY